MERQREKQEVEEQTDRLDEEFKLLMKQGTFASHGSNRTSMETREKVQSALLLFSHNNYFHQDSFNALYHELSQDLKGAATDRLKTPEDLLREQKARLDALEV